MKQVSVTPAILSLNREGLYPFLGGLGIYIGELQNVGHTRWRDGWPVTGSGPEPVTGGVLVSDQTPYRFTGQPFLAESILEIIQKATFRRFLEAEMTLLYTK